jgi:hypothetical protein
MPNQQKTKIEYKNSKILFFEKFYLLDVSIFEDNIFQKRKMTNLKKDDKMYI